MNKKLSFFILVISVLFLSACKPPFMPPEKDKALHYIDSNISLLNASQETDKIIIEELSNLNEDVEFDQLLKKVGEAKKRQKDLFLQLDADVEPKGLEEVKRTYLNVIQGRITSYNHFIKIINDDRDLELLKQSIKTHQAKDKNIEEKALMEVNYILRDLKEEEKAKLYDKLKSSASKK